MTAQSYINILYSARYPYTRMLYGSRFAPLLDLGDSESLASEVEEDSELDEEEKSETTCCICMDRMSCVSIGPCGHSAFCFPCIFNVCAQIKSCPLCRGPINDCDADANCSLNFLSELLPETYEYDCERKYLETMGDLAEFYGHTVKDTLDYLISLYLVSFRDDSSGDDSDSDRDNED